MNIPNLLASLDIPAAAEQDLYTVPGSQSLTVQGFEFCNRNAGANSFRLSISLAGAATAAADYLYYDLPMTANNSFLVELDTVLPAAAVIRVYSVTGNVTVNLFGVLT